MVLGAHERMGGRSLNSTSGSNFANMIAMINLQKIESKGASFTWARRTVMGIWNANLTELYITSAG